VAGAAVSVFADRVEYLDTPGRPDFPRYDVDVVSPEMPCGAGWLATALLELGVPLWKPWGIRDESLWEHRGERRYRHVCAGSSWSRLVVGFEDGREMDFRSAPVPRFSHAWPGLAAPLPALVVVVRDPRDTLYSAWRRGLRSGQLAGGIPFEEFVAAPFHHRPVSWTGYLALFLTLWRRAAAGRHHLVLRFEDAKADPRETLRRVLRYLAIEAAAAEIDRACEVADHATIKSIEQRLIADGIVPTPFLADGIPYEHRRHFDRAMHAAIGPTLDAVCDWLGYEQAPLGAGGMPGRERPRHLDIDPDALAASLAQDSAGGAERVVRLAADLRLALGDLRAAG
jgi:hypothetical protein